ncbi:HNH endonuclease [Lysobacter capsici]|uniref:HNH endonuclease n=1 Tax=Lysobacter capsici TaxID=435897 RepID=UPI001786C629|nr:HNH endonuclease [Lysobacter capsici]UOF15586.1 HNH endonuclease [Lysobacter capsici]
MIELPFEVGALYHRGRDIHGLLGGQRQGGISTPKDQPFVIIFTGEAGKSHSYDDGWDDDNVFHYFGEGQNGDMQYTGGNRAVENHVADGKRLLLFQMMGHGKPCRYDGEFVKLSSYLKPNSQDTKGALRTAIVFRLVPVSEGAFFQGTKVAETQAPYQTLDSTVSKRLQEVRSKQSLFRRRLLSVEKQCRLTGIQDLRFLRASHIKPWADCISGNERTDGHNGMLLTPQADLLFDRGWITFEDKGRLVVTSDLPSDVIKRLGLNLRPGRNCGLFNDKQTSYLDYHRAQVFERRYKKSADPIEDLVGDLLGSVP